MYLWFSLWNLTYGCLQSLVGLLCFLFCISDKHFYFKGALVTKWKSNYGLSLGFFIFIPEMSNEFLLHHEYGHFIQSLFLGPLYLFIIGIPSLLWNRIFFPKQKRRHNYYQFITESSANSLSRKYLKLDSNLRRRKLPDQD